MSNSLIPSFMVSNVSKFLRSLTKNERCERIAHVAHQKWANEWIACIFERICSENHWANSQPSIFDVTESLRLLTKNERMSESLVFWANRSFTHFFAKKRAIRSENRRANSQPCIISQNYLKVSRCKVQFLLQLCLKNANIAYPVCSSFILLTNKEVMESVFMKCI